MNFDADQAADSSLIAQFIAGDFYGHNLDLRARSRAPIPGWDGMLEVSLAKELREDSVRDEELRLVLTLLIAMDRARDSGRLWSAGLKLFRETPWPFRPAEVVKRSLSELRDVLASNNVSQRHGEDASAWRIISETIAGNRSELVARVIRHGVGDTVQLDEAVRANSLMGQPLFPLLRGPKIRRVWIRLMAYPGGSHLQRIDLIPVAVDAQVRRATETLGVTSTADMTLEEARPIIQEAWRAAVAPIEVIGPTGLSGACAALDPALWFYGRWGCDFCENAGGRHPIGRACRACQLPVTAKPL